MSSSTSSAEPKELSHYSTSAIHLDLDVLTTSHRLTGVLHQFEATCTEPAFRVRVSHMADVMGRHARTAEPVDYWVNIVGRGFRAADSRALPVRTLPWLHPIFLFATLPRTTALGRLMAASQREEFPNLFPIPVVIIPILTPGSHASPYTLDAALSNVNSALGRALHSIRRLIFALRWRRIIDVIRNPPWFHWPWPRLPWPSWPRITIPKGPGAWRGILPFIPGIRWFAPKAPEGPSPTPMPGPTPAPSPAPAPKTPPQKSTPKAPPSAQPGPKDGTKPPSKTPPPSWNEPVLRQTDPTGDSDTLDTKRTETNDGQYEINPFTGDPIITVRDHIKAYGCLLAAFTMLLNNRGYDVSMSDVYKALYQTKTKGKNFDEDAKDGAIMLGDLNWSPGPIASITGKQYKEISTQIDKSEEAIKGLLVNEKNGSVKKNSPIIIEVLMGSPKKHWKHWIVVDGYDSTTHEFFVRDPLKGAVKKKIPGDYNPTGNVRYIKAQTAP